MARECKICGAAARRDIEARIVAGDSLKAVADYCKNSGLDITHMAVKRHADSHMPAGARPGKIQAGLAPDEIEKISGELLAIAAPEIHGADDLRGYVRELLPGIVANQLAIIAARQKSYMAGAGRYPDRELAGLRTLIACLDSLTERRGAVLNTDNIGATIHDTPSDLG